MTWRHRHRFCQNCMDPRLLLSSDFGTAPNGDAIMKWDNKRIGATFTIIFKEDDKINYSGSWADGEETHGTVHYGGLTPPDVILWGITKTFFGKKFLRKMEKFCADKEDFEHYCFRMIRKPGNSYPRDKWRDKK